MSFLTFITYEVLLSFLTFITYGVLMSFLSYLSTFRGQRLARKIKKEKKNHIHK